MHFLLFLAAGCASDSSPGPHSLNEAAASTKSVSGDANTVFTVCTAIGYDSDGDGIDDTFAMVIGKDADGDAFAVEPTNSSDITADGEYGCSFDLLDGFIVISSASAVGLDCNDSDSTIYTGAQEIMDDGIDQDCDGSDSQSDPDADGDGFAASADCDDSNVDIHPGADEKCDGLDNNCDGLVDDSSAVDASTWYEDSDVDNYGNAAISVMSCNQPTSYVADSTDCDDADSTVNPGATEVCDAANVDEDCDGLVNDADPSVASFSFNTFYLDADGDGYGDPGNTETTCDQPSGYVSNSGDCDDLVFEVNPDQDEECDGIDNNCDGLVDDSSSVDAITWYQDADGDGYGNFSVSAMSCAQPSGYVMDSADCDDSLSGVNPGAAEVCDAIDNDCDNQADEGGVCGDPDSDGDGDPDSTDCNDADSAIYTGAPEIFDSLDNNCDGLVDEEIANDGLDNDGDGAATDYVCVTANTTTYDFMIQLSDLTVYPWTPADQNWLGGYGTGNGEVCGSFPLVAGNSLKVQGGFDQDGDGSYGEEVGDYWLYMLNTVNASTVTIMDMDVTSSVVLTTWDGNGDGIADGADGVMTTIPTLPTQ
jgi:hypothetical protein